MGICSSQTILYTDDMYYKGKTLDQVPHGKGKFVVKDCEYIGTFYHGQIISGLMKYKSEDGQINTYEGEFLNFIRHGYGTEKYLNGWIYSGYWESNELKSGTIIYDKGTVYQGQIFQFRPHGKGEFEFMSESGGRERYVGDFVNSEMTGHGESYHNDIITYAGEFLQGQYHGYGTLFYKNGAIRYQGGWKFSQIHGQGALYHPTGKKYMTGLFEEGKTLETTYDVVEWGRSTKNPLMDKANILRQVPLRMVQTWAPSAPPMNDLYVK